MCFLRPLPGAARDCVRYDGAANTAPQEGCRDPLSPARGGAADATERLSMQDVLQLVVEADKGEEPGRTEVAGYRGPVEHAPRIGLRIAAHHLGHHPAHMHRHLST